MKVIYTSRKVFSPRIDKFYSRLSYSLTKISFSNFFKTKLTLTKSKEPMQLKTFYLDVDVSRINFSHCQSKIQFLKKNKLETIKHCCVRRREKIPI